MYGILRGLYKWETFFRLRCIWNWIVALKRILYQEHLHTFTRSDLIVLALSPLCCTPWLSHRAIGRSVICSPSFCTGSPVLLECCICLFNASKSSLQYFSSWLILVLLAFGSENVCSLHCLFGAWKLGWRKIAAPTLPRYSRCPMCLLFKRSWDCSGVAFFDKPSVVCLYCKYRVSSDAFHLFPNIWFKLSILWSTGEGWYNGLILLFFSKP